MFLSIVQATVAAFVFFCVMADCFGPSSRTFIDNAAGYIVALFRTHPLCAALVVFVLLTALAPKIIVFGWPLGRTILEENVAKKISFLERKKAWRSKVLFLSLKSNINVQTYS